MNESSISLTATYPLPEGWSGVDVVHDTIAIDGVEITRAGVSATGPSGEEVTGSAARVEVSPAATAEVVARSWYELLERVATLEAIDASPRAWPVRGAGARAHRLAASCDLFPVSATPEIWTYARSNGVAIHSGREEAFRRARLELIERHRVLSAWYGLSGWEQVRTRASNALVDGASAYEWLTYRLHAVPGCSSEGTEVAIVVGFSRAEGPLPLALGFGAAESLESAVDTAAREAAQLLAFLWGEPVAEAPTSSAPTSMLHLERYQSPEGQKVLRRWLARGGEPSVSTGIPMAGNVEFVEIAPGWLQGMCVAKAVHANALPLAFGAAPFARNVPLDRSLHPIP